MSNTQNDILEKKYSELITDAEKEQWAAAQLTRSSQRSKGELEAKHSQGQLMIWAETERAIPNDLARTSFFSIRNKSVQRNSYLASSQLIIPIDDRGEIRYNGEELRQEEETVWLQLVHIAKQTQQNRFSIMPRRFLIEIGWNTSGKDYLRLTECLRRLASANFEIYDKKTKWTRSTRLIALYGFNDSINKNVEIKLYDDEDDLLFLFAQNVYTKLDWGQRKVLPTGLATWLHTFYSTHKIPFDLTLEYLAKKADTHFERKEDKKLTEEVRRKKISDRVAGFKKAMHIALQNLVTCGFLKSYEITADNLVKVIRAK